MQPRQAASYNQGNEFNTTFVPMPKKKLDYIIIEDGQPTPTRRLRFILIGMLLGMLTITAAFLAVTWGGERFGPIAQTPTFPPSVTAIPTLTANADQPITGTESVAISPDGAILAVGLLGEGGWSVELRRFNGLHIADTERITRFPVTAPPLHLTFSPDGKWLAVTGGAPIGWNITEIYDAHTGAPRFALDGGYAAFSLDSQLLATTSYDGAIFLRDVASGALLKTLYHPGGSAHQVQFTPDGRGLVAAVYMLESTGSNNRGLSQWDLTNLDAPPITHELFTDWIPYFDLSPDGRFTMIAQRGGVQVIDERQDSLLQWGIKDGIAEMVAFSPDGEWLALGFNGLYPSPTHGNVYGPISLYSVAQAREVRLMVGYSDYPQLSDLAFAPDGAYLLSAGANATLIQWNYLDGTEISRLEF